MKRTLYIIVGLLIGLLLGEMLRRQKMERLALFEAKEARHKAQYARYEQEWQEELATLPFDERMEYELWEAGMRLNNWMPPLDSAQEDDDASET